MNERVALTPHTKGATMIPTSPDFGLTSTDDVFARTPGNEPCDAEPMTQQWRLFSSDACFTICRTLPMLCIGLSLDGFGQMLGYAFGAGPASKPYAELEFDRFDHVTVEDRHELAGKTALEAGGAS